MVKENIIIIRYFEKKNMRVALVAHIIFSIVFSLYMLFLPMFDLSMLLIVSTSGTPVKTLFQIIINSKELSLNNLNTIVLVPLILFYLMIIASTVVLLELKIPFESYYENKIYLINKNNINKIYKLQYLSFRKLFLINCRLKN
ncbi:MAG: hypothetical protein WCY04_05950 [Bacilli bacterium]